MEYPVNFLKHIKILEECDMQERKTVEDFLEEYYTKKNEILFNQGDPGTALFIVREGIMGSYVIQKDGSRREVARFSRGMSFGEMAIIESLPRSSTCYAVTDVELLVFEATRFHSFIEQYPKIAIKIVKAMTRNIISWLYDANNFLNTMVMWGEKARLRAITDELTGLYNRRFIEESLEHYVSKSRNKKEHFCLLMFDLDNFHNVNEYMGVEAGDDILRITADLLKSVFPENSIVSRLGGDEFAMILPAVSLEQAVSPADTFRKTLCKKDFKNSQARKIQVSASIGIAEYPLHGETAVTLKEAADKALFHAKESGKNIIICTSQLV